jgi:hypothetical protein
MRGPFCGSAGGKPEAAYEFALRVLGGQADKASTSIIETLRTRRQRSTKVRCPHHSI